MENNTTITNSRRFQTKQNNTQNLFGIISDKKLFWIIAALAVIFYLSFLKFRALWDPGEGRYALIPAEMLKNRDWIIPTLNGTKYIKNPPFGYWLSSISMWLFGINEFAARLPTAIGAILTVIGTYFFTRRTFDRQTAIFSAAILFTSLGFFAYSQISELEMLFTCFLCWGLGFLVVDFERGKRRSIPIHIGYFMLSLAFLTKGISAFIFAGIVIPVYLTVSKQWHRWQRLYPFTGILLVFIITVPWFFVVAVKEPKLLKFFLKTHFSSSFSLKNLQQLWYYIPFLIMGFAPWIVVFFNALKKTWFIKENLKPHTKKIFIYLVVWFTAGFIIFSFSHSKRPPSILPILPPLAIITGYYFATIWCVRVLLKKTIAALIMVFSFLVAALLFMPEYTTHVTRNIAMPLFVPLSILSISIICAFILIKKSSAKNLFLLMFVFALLFDTTVYLQSFKLDGIFSRKRLASVINSEYKNGEKIFSYHCNFERNMQSLGFYTGERIYIVGSRGELQFGSSFDGYVNIYFPSDAEFYKEIKSQKRIYAVIKIAHFDYLSKTFGSTLYPANVIAGNFMLVSNSPWKKENAL
jgi:4-amino-4-deoxy-L-arabinose transferase-like glycosyltransferase